MAWDFSTEPEFQPDLGLDQGIRRGQIRPIDCIHEELGPGSLDLLTHPLKEEVKRRNLWAAHLDPELGGQGMGQVELAQMHETLGRYSIAPMIFGNQAPELPATPSCSRSVPPKSRRTVGCRRYSTASCAARSR